MSDRVIETRALQKRFGPKVAVEGLSLSVNRGEIFGFLGPNGAGKTTSLKMLVALVPPTAGSGTVLGAPLGDRAVRARIGFLPEHFRFHDCLTGRELLRFHGRLHGLRGVTLDVRIDDHLLGLTALPGHALIVVVTVPGAVHVRHDRFHPDPFTRPRYDLDGARRAERCEAGAHA
jgi:ABC-2 type transport system ATP-binding protein